MKKMIMLFITLVSIYFLIQLGFIFFGKGYEKEYTISENGKEFKITEKYVRNTKNEKNGYLLKIDTGKNIFSYQVLDNLNDKEIVKKIKYYQDDNMECILPLFHNNKTIFDVTCNINGVEYYYHNMDKKPDGLVKFVESLNYDKDKFIDNGKSKQENDIYTVYENNVVKNHYVLLTNYQGVMTINDRNVRYVLNKQIFDSDQYSRPISAFTKNYYVVADYEQNYEFDKFYVFDFKNNYLKEIKTKYKISFDTYVQGVVDDIIYIFDLDNKVQYEINPKSLEITRTGDVKSNIKFYENGIWSKINVNDVINNKPLFITSNRVIKNGNIIDNLGSNLTGYIYTYEKNGNKYKVYLSNTFTPDIKNYLFEIDDIDSIIYVDNYIYFKDGNKIKYYSEKTGLRTLIESEELIFNKNLMYNVTK